MKRSSPSSPSLSELEACLSDMPAVRPRLAQEVTIKLEGEQPLPRRLSGSSSGSGVSSALRFLEANPGFLESAPASPRPGT